MEFQENIVNGIYFFRENVIYISQGMCEIVIDWKCDS